MLPSTPPPPPSFANDEPSCDRGGRQCAVATVQAREGVRKPAWSLCKNHSIAGLSRCDEDGRKPPSASRLEDGVDSRGLDACTVVEVRAVVARSILRRLRRWNQPRENDTMKQKCSELTVGATPECSASICRRRAWRRWSAHVDNRRAKTVSTTTFSRTTRPADGLPLSLCHHSYVITLAISPLEVNTPHLALCQPVSFTPSKISVLLASRFNLLPTLKYLRKWEFSVVLEVFCGRKIMGDDHSALKNGDLAEFAPGIPLASPARGCFYANEVGQAPTPCRDCRECLGWIW